MCVDTDVCACVVSHHCLSPFSCDYVPQIICLSAFDLKAAAASLTLILYLSMASQKKNLSLNKFSQPYSESGLAGYADDSSQLGLFGSN